MAVGGNPSLEARMYFLALILKYGIVSLWGLLSMTPIKEVQAFFNDLP